MTLLAATFLPACGKSDKPMPLSQSNVAEYTKVVTALAQSVSPSPGQTIVDGIALTYKKGAEKVGYDFDKTFRYVVAFEWQKGSPIVVMMVPAYQAILDNLDESVQKGLISQRTRDLMVAQNQVGVPLDQKAMNFVEVTKDCISIMNAPDGACTSRILRLSLQKMD